RIPCAGPMPANVRAPTSDIVRMAKERAASEHRLRMAERVAVSEKANQVRVFLLKSPVEPAQLVVVVVRIVVAMLGSTGLVTHHDHGDTLAHHQQTDRVLYLLAAQGIYARIVGLAFPAAV